jgi:hypothetical protein
MYKIPLHIIEGFLNSLEQSNELLKGMVGSDRSAEVNAAIAENNKQIELIKTNYTFGYEHKR